ncbi:PTS mannose/fructose/sorbose/N-acetylgalactosamine transporter subunit IIC [Lactobacillus hominis]|uniref:Phosphoenolpyruvate-dependent sugar phosphotransferase system EIIC, mannose specific n=1 Tax=Lactobacillus hominis DSM 23910 = CRBIP 24.179 TaxID=1423758 RepID=I7IVV6_9LACO|nr:PTS sugar transporter subunit IIC [Lactobacillus hominis]KRM84563.1 phosphotransferase system, mannose fructose N-acetylgalactosamine-specific component IIC [Lactobacillus hominis DSM 23910 = CRBIP 24.179]CCI82108.1 Phosphoenolpyruvate-dependent sugar phosphotransferase system EIIC, mannose specific [Lactobacillus hominis DSM 23910 = CRBIP 24.179]
MIAWWQILLLTLYAGYEILDELQIYSSLNTPVGAGLVAGIVMGDMGKGLMIGAAMQLMVLGVGTFGGASKIDATTGTVLATAFSVSVSGLSWQAAVSSIAVPVAAIMVQLDVLARFTNTFFAHRIDHFIDTQNYKAIERNFLYGAIPWALSRAIPVFVALAFGRGLVQNIANALNGDLKWLGTGLTVAGAALPAVGFAILLRYLPVKKHIAYLILGFTVTTLFATMFTNIQTLGTGLAAASKGFTTVFNGLPMLAIALLGLALAILHYKGIPVSKAKSEIDAQSAEKTSLDANDEGEITDDEL